MKGIFRPISIQDYGLFEGKKVIFRFTVLDPKLRVKINHLDGQEVDFEKQIKPLITEEEKKDAVVEEEKKVK